MPVRTPLFALLLGYALAPAASALTGFPAYVALPRDVDVPGPSSLTDETLGEAEFPLAEGKTVTKQGHHYRSYLAFASGTNPGAAATWAAWRPSLERAGFTVVGNDGGTTYTLTRTAGGVESWLRVAFGDYNDPLVELVEVGSQRPAFALASPARTAETIGDGDDFPYLGHYPGTTLRQTVHDNEPLDLGSIGGEAAAVGSGHVVKYYNAPSTLSRLELHAAYRAALAKAGWQVAAVPAGGDEASSPVVAHYGRDGRNLWVSIRRGDPGSDEGILVAVADLGAEDLGARLDHDCRIALTGVLFDFDKAALQSTSLPALEAARALLAARPQVSVEVQGHTDDVGSDAHNDQLSAARAETVRQWLLAHGIAAGRLSAKGYGKRQPIADNGSDLGRARNRRVELVRLDCP